ncbi:MAG: carbohydrate ABC transporter substrate-binding protein [Desulfobacterales bacterium]|nr:MAG: carbohydrate ABC transporter substrate-binding protein [Desulfobacterales bacterium]
MGVKRIIAAMLVLALVLVGAGPAMAAPHTLKVWIMTTFADAQNNWVRAKVEAWAQEASVTVDIAMLPRTAYGEKIFASIEARTPPDVVLMAEPGATLAAELGLTIPLDDVVEKIGRDDFYPRVLSAVAAPDAVTGAMRIWGIPMFFEIRPAEIRMDLLEKAGLTIPAKPDYEWLFKAARAMNDPPKVYGLGHVLGRSYDAHDNTMALIYSYGGGLIADRGPNGADIFNTEPTWRAFDDLKKLYKEGVIPPDAVAWGDYDNNLALMGGRVAITVNGLSIYYKMVKDKNPLAEAVKEVPLTGAWIDNAGGESNFVFKSTPVKEQLGKDLLAYLMMDKEDYRVGICENSQLYALPVFKSQAQVISQQWKDGKWPVYAIDPTQAIETAYNSWPTVYPLNEATSVVEKFMGAYMLPEMMTVLFTRETDSKKVAEDISKALNKLLVETYGK